MRATVLLIDDSLTVRMDLAEAFEEAGFSVVGCATAADAREAFTRLAVGAVVLDVVLPDGDGIELLGEIRGMHPRVPVLMLSSEAEVRDRVRALQTGADEYVGKPYDRSYVVAKARELVRVRAPETTGSRSRVLVIDDSPTFRETLRLAIERAGYDVLVAASGEEGLRTAADRRPSAIIVDGVLPGIDGPTVIRHVRLDAALRTTPCLLLTATEGNDVELRALDAGADAFVRKDEDLSVILARLAAALRAASAHVEDQATASLLGPHKILAVDDSPTYLHELAAILRGDGYDVALARSGEEALELLAVQPVDCVLLDLLMPGLGGKETCRRIKAAPVVRDIPLIMLTALEDRSSMLEGLGAGADDYIPKSSEFAVLKARVRAQIRRKQFEDENRRIREQLLRKEFEASEARAARELAEARAALTDELERQNRELEAFSYSVSHDLRAPLRSIDGFSRMLEEDYRERLDEQGLDYLRRVRNSAHRMAELIEDLLALARVGRADLRRQVLDLTSEARRIIAQLAERDPARHIAVNVPDGIVAEGDPGLVRSLLENLLSNAWKFSARRQDAQIEIGVTDRNGGRAYYVRDNGVGFELAQAERLFQPFQRLHSAAEFEGTGVGLATVHRIVTRHGGRIWAEASAGGGATFYFTLRGADG